MDYTDNSRKDRMEKLAAGYLDGTLTDSQEGSLRKMLENGPREGLPEELEALAVMARGFSSLRSERMDMGAAIRRARRKKILAAVSTLTAAAAVAVTVLFAARPVYGYDEHGRKITSRREAMAQAECMEMLSGLGSSIEMSLEFTETLENRLYEK